MIAERRCNMAPLFYAWLVFNQATTANTSRRRSFTRHARFERYASPLQTEEDISLVQCMVLCGQVRSCESVSYQQTTRQCEINSAYPAQSIISGISAPGWRVYYPSEYDLTMDANTWQSSTYCSPYGLCGTAPKAIDGNQNGNFHAGSCAVITPSPAPPYWAVKLASPTSVERVCIYFRSDCCTFRLQNVTIMVAQTRKTITTGGTKCADYTGPPSVSERRVVIACTTPVYGQYVKILLNYEQYLELCEVVVNSH